VTRECNPKTDRPRRATPKADIRCIMMQQGDQQKSLICVKACRKKAKVREICMYCSKTSHASEDCPVKLAAEEGHGTEDEEISNSEGEDNEAEAEQSCEPETIRHQPAVAPHRSQSGRDASYSPEVQASRAAAVCTCTVALLIIVVASVDSIQLFATACQPCSARTTALRRLSASRSAYQGCVCCFVKHCYQSAKKLWL